MGCLLSVIFVLFLSVLRCFHEREVIYVHGCGSDLREVTLVEGSLFGREVRHGEGFMWRAYVKLCSVCIVTVRAQ